MKVNNDQFEGYAIDLLDEISRIVKFNYSLYAIPDESTGMIQELWLKVCIIN